MAIPAKKDAVEVVPHVPSDAASMLSVIERMALNPDLDITRLKELMEMYKDIVARNAKSAYTAALSQLQLDLPVIERKGKIEYTGKDGKARTTPYALWEDINEQIKPHLAAHGFALSFKSENGEGKIKIICYLSHVGGHEEETWKTLPYDATGAKNAVQSIGSSSSYGKRYTASDLLNLTSRGEDDNGATGGGDAKVDDEQVAKIENEIATVDIKRDRVLKKYGIAEISDLPASKFDDIMQDLDAYLKEKTKTAKGAK